MLLFDVRPSCSPPGYPCAKFHFCCTLHCWASPRRKIAYSITHSPSWFDLPGSEGYHFGIIIVIIIIRMLIMCQLTDAEEHNLATKLPVPDTVVQEWLATLSTVLHEWLTETWLDRRMTVLNEIKMNIIPHSMGLGIIT